MGKVESSVTIARPVEDVYRHFLDLDKNATDPDTESVSKEPPGPTQSGTLFRFHHAKGRETTMRFVSLEPERRIGIEGDVGPAKPERRLAVRVLGARRYQAVGAPRTQSGWSAEADSAPCRDDRSANLGQAALADQGRAGGRTEAALRLVEQALR